MPACPCNRCSACPCRSSGACRRVPLGHELAVRGADGEVLVALFELEAQVDDVLLYGEVVLRERVDVGGSAEPGRPGALAEVGGPVELLDADGRSPNVLLSADGEGIRLDHGQPPPRGRIHTDLAP